MASAASFLNTLEHRHAYAEDDAPTAELYIDEPEPKNYLGHDKVDPQPVLHGYFSYPISDAGVMAQPEPPPARVIDLGSDWALITVVTSESSSDERTQVLTYILEARRDVSLAELEATSAGTRADICDPTYIEKSISLMMSAYADCDEPFALLTFEGRTSLREAECYIPYADGEADANGLGPAVEVVSVTALQRLQLMYAAGQEDQADEDLAALKKAYELDKKVYDETSVVMVVY